MTPFKKKYEFLGVVICKDRLDNVFVILEKYKHNDSVFYIKNTERTRLEKYKTFETLEDAEKELMKILEKTEAIKTGRYEEQLSGIYK